MKIDFDHPANRGIANHLREPHRLHNSVSVAKDRPFCLPADVEKPYLRLGTHPDLLERLWDQLGAVLPLDCRVIVYGMPALAHPKSGVIFGFAGGTHTYGLRLPPAEKAAALAAGAKTVHHYPAYPSMKIEASVLDLADFGDEWILCEWYKGEEDWCRAAFAHAQQ